MARLHLFELEDQGWFPDWLRRPMTDYIQFLANKMNIYRSMIPVITDGLQAAGNNKFIDLCSGGGGGVASISAQLRKQMGPGFKIILSDLYPNIPAFQRIKAQDPETIDFVSEPVDVKNVPDNLKGLRVMQTSFHHFQPDDATKILSDSVRSEQPILIMEGTYRSVIHLIPMIFLPVIMWFVTPFIRPVTWSRLVFTYPIPLIPLSAMWDGFVSVLRTYSVEEMKSLTLKADPHGLFRWDTHKGDSRNRITYLYGRKK